MRAGAEAEASATSVWSVMSALKKQFKLEKKNTYGDSIEQVSFRLAIATSMYIISKRK